ncbi:hypothetical protein [Sorangium sp. So ce542]|uniref:hypothetical protein n=1 Tax=Sorangium sp. So ce542 TaxID=3133316 RepID=UPI003F62350D
MRATTLVAVSFVALVGCSDSGGGNLGGGGAGPLATTGAEGSGGSQGGSGGEGGGAGGGLGGEGGGLGGEGGGLGGEGGGLGGEGGGLGGEGGGLGGEGGGLGGEGGGLGGEGGGLGGEGGGLGGEGGESATAGSGGEGGGVGGEGGEGGGAAAFGPCGTSDLALGDPEAFLDLGHERRLARLFVSGGRVLSWDYDRWILWDTDTGAAIADGRAPGGIDPGDPLAGEPESELPGGVALRGDVVLVQTNPQHAFELRSAVDGSLLASVTAEYEDAGLATDGSYAWTRDLSARTITLWSTAGVERWSAAVSHYGDVHAAPDALRIGPGIAPLQNSIAVLPADGSPPTVTPAFSGTFHAWFQDGERFLTTAGTTVRVYSKAAIQESIVNMSSIKHLAGTRDYFWSLADSTPGDPLVIYRVGGGAVPVAEYRERADYRYTFVPTERALALLRQGEPRLDIVDLDGAEVTLSEHPLPLANNGRVYIDQDLRWAVSNGSGAIAHQGTLTDPEGSGLLGCGALNAITGSPSGPVALATASGKTLIYDTAALDAGPSAIVPFHSSKVLLSSDGSLLAARAALDSYTEDRSLRLFSLPDGEELASISRDRVVQDFSMSFDGSTVGRTYHIDGRMTERVVSGWSGGEPLFQDTGIRRPAPLVSPDGHRFVVTDAVPTEGCGFTQFYEDGALVNAVPGCAIGWIDDSRVLVQTYVFHSGRTRWEYKASTIYDELGNPIAAPPLPMIPIRTDINFSPSYSDYGIQPVSATVLYSRGDGVLYDIDTGAKLATFPYWRSAAAGAFMVYPCGHGVCAETY